MKALTLLSTFYIVLFLVSGCAKPKPSDLELKSNWEIQSSAKINSVGSVISTVEFKPESWYPANVPTTVLAALVENNVYPDPYYGENLNSITAFGIE